MAAAPVLYLQKMSKFPIDNPGGIMYNKNNSGAAYFVRHCRHTLYLIKSGGGTGPVKPGNRLTFSSHTVPIPAV